MISTYVDDILEKVLKRMSIELPDYTPEIDPTKQKFCELEWTISADTVKSVEKMYNEKVKAERKRKSDAAAAAKNASTDDSDEVIDKKKVKSETIKLEQTSNDDVKTIKPEIKNEPEQREENGEQSIESSTVAENNHATNGKDEREINQEGNINNEQIAEQTNETVTVNSAAHAEER